MAIDSGRSGASGTADHASAATGPEAVGVGSSPAERLGGFACDLPSSVDVEVLSLWTTAAAADNIYGAEHAGITSSRDGRLRSLAPTSSVVERIDEAQHSTGQGPCVDVAMRHRAVVQCNDLSHDERFPAFGPAAARAGIRSMLSFQLTDDNGRATALNLYAAQAYAFSREAVDMGRMIAAHAALALMRAADRSGLVAALDGRDVIGQAKGILMERHHIDPDAAFYLLIQASQSSDRKLADVAATLARTGELPGAG